MQGPFYVYKILSEPLDQLPPETQVVPYKRRRREDMKIGGPIDVTSFSSFTEENSEYWPQKRTQSGNTHSIILDVHVGRQFNSHRPSVFLFGQQEFYLSFTSCKSWNYSMYSYCMGLFFYSCSHTKWYTKYDIT